MNKWGKLNKNFYPTVVLDNDSGKVGSLLNGVPIDSVTNIQKYLDGHHKIVITTSYVNEIKAQLQKMNIFENTVDWFEFDNNVSKIYLERNARLLNEKKTKRCFIIGTGPSLAELDLNLLMNEDKIMVNSFYKNEELVKLNPKFWVLADENFWLNQTMFLDPILNTLATKLTSTQLLIWDEALPYLTIPPTIENRFSYYHLDKVAKYEISPIDFTDTLPHFAYNVISVALMLAIYLKYEEIICIGCDHTWWGYSKEEVAEGIALPHYYEKNEKEIKFFESSFRKMGYDRLQETVELQKMEYNALRNMAEQYGLQVYNATPGGYLESFERRKYEDFFITD